MPDTFEGFIRFGRTFMGGGHGGDPAAGEFRRLLGKISTVFEKTHGMVIARLRGIVATTDVEGARAIVEELRGDALSQGFHAENLCDRFVQLGCELDGLVRQLDGAPPDSGVDHARDLVDQLQRREYQVALLYGETIDGLSGLLTTGDAEPLEDIQERAGTAERELTRQMEEFRRLAAEFGR